MLLTGVLDEVLDWLLRRRGADRELSCGLRVTEGRSSGLSERWVHRDVVLRTGRLRYWRWYGRVTVPVTSVERVGERVVRLHSTSAVLELATDPRFRDPVYQLLRPRDAAPNDLDPNDERRSSPEE